jgi:drug/metabolite transporter (DMT)-like permease
MSLIAIILLSLSAVLHASWNLISKRQNPSTSFFLVANAIGYVWFIPILFMKWDFVVQFPPKLWILIAATGLFQTLYFYALAGAYRGGDMSIAYPMARSIPVILVALVTFMLGRGRQISTESIVGMLLVVTGCFLLPIRHPGDLRVNDYLRTVCLFALLAACGTAGYSMIDDEALRLMRGMTAAAGSLQMTTTLLYAFFEGASIIFFLAVLVLARKKGRADLGSILRSAKWNASLAGIAMIVTYTLVLMSMAFVANISYVVAFRQLSIPIGAMMGWFVLREPVYATRMVGLITAMTGLALVAMG